MTTTSDFNAKVVEEFRTNEGRVGPPFEGAPITLLHHRGRKSGVEYLSPMMYLGDADDPDTIYVFASKGGAPTNPEWYYNLLSAGQAEVEVGTETYPVTVRDLSGDERERVFRIQAGRYPGFADYEQKTSGIRKIPVVALTRART